jgi:hypothetical protein
MAYLSQLFFRKELPTLFPLTKFVLLAMFVDANLGDNNDSSN